MGGRLSAAVGSVTVSGREGGRQGSPYEGSGCNLDEIVWNPGVDEDH